MLNFYENRKKYKLLRNNPPTETPDKLEEDDKDVFSATCVIGSILLAGALMVGGCVAQAEEIPAEEAAMCIVGEASGEGMKGMMAVAQAIKNRGHLRGVYGCKAKHIKNESKDTKDLARWTWMQLELYPEYYKPFTALDFVKGANSWGTDSDIKKNHMDEDCKETAKIGKHTFFICGRRAE